MNDAASPSRWFHAWRSQPRETQLDPADLGTAFGLEASFAAEVAPRAPLSPAKPGWMRRLSSRGERPT